jgi:hypothetical protein
MSSYLLQLTQERKARLLRLNYPPRVPDTRPPVRLIEIVNGKQKLPEPPPPPPPPRLPKVELPMRKEFANLPSVDEVVLVVAEFYGVTRADLLSRDRHYTCALRRHVTMLLACTLSGRSLPEVGRRMGGFDHTSVIHGRDRIRRLMTVSPELTDQVQQLKRLIGLHVRVRNGEQIMEAAE